MSDKIKTLSQAIRLGATFRPQAFTLYFDSINNTTCAIGAAIEAIAGEEAARDHDFMVVESRFHPPDSVWCEIFRRNDRGDTREEIATWLEAQGL